MDKIDRWLYINLEESVDRKKRIEEELSKVTINFNRINAISDPNTVTGCLKSHLKAVEFAKENNFSVVAILEDDFLFQNIETLYEDMDKLFKENFDGAELWISPNGKPYIKNITENVYKCFNTAGTVGYILKLNIFDIVINAFHEALLKNIAADIALWSVQRSVKWITIYPYIGKHVEGYSTILKKNRLHINGYNPS